MRLHDKTWITATEDYGVPRTVGEWLTTFLESTGLDFWNDEFVIRVTVDRPDPEPKAFEAK